ncbi:glycosyltransferase family 1 protein [Nanoarchaeota archaeon]|nr:MAG: glycosyltransferase family 1 protein [Nanoarchaeota archaeon]
MIGWELPPFSTGGLGTHCYSLTKRLSKYVSIFFTMPNRKGVPSYDFMEIIPIPSPSLGVGVYVTADHKVHYMSDWIPHIIDVYAKEIVKAVKNIDFDLIHSHDWLTAPAAMAVKKLTGKPWIYTVHSTEWDRSGGSPWPEALAVETEGLRNADMIIAVSNRTKNMLIEKYGIPPEKIRVVYNATEPITYRGRKYSKMVLYLGRLTVQKGLYHFLHAAKLVLEKDPNVLFVIAGTGPDEDYLINLSIELGIHNNVVFTGFVPDEEVKKLYGSASLYVLPSKSEPFGITVLEAMSAGTPVIVSKQTGVSEVIRNCIKVDFWDTRLMASAILEVLNYPSLMESLRANGYKDLHRITWEDSARKTYNVYRDVLNL